MSRVGVRQLKDRLSECLGSQEVEAQLYRGGNLVDVLAAGTGGADEAQFEIGVGDLDVT